VYTRCPHCLTVFVVAAEQLKAAHGNVRCGTCLESFDAIPHLSDGPVQALPAPSEAEVAVEAEADFAPPVEVEPDVGGEPEIDTAAGFDVAPEVGSEPAIAPEPEFVTDDAGEPRSAAEQLSSTLDAVRAAASDDETPPTAKTSRQDGGRGNGVETDRASSDTARRVSVLDDPEPEDDAPPPEALPEALPEVLREEVEDLAARSASRRRAVGYGVAALALLVLIAGQYVFFMPEDAVRRYPQWRGAIESMCIRIGCVLPERRDPGRIRVVSRDVRVHPKIEGVMQIKATLTNSAPYRQSYPLVRFTLFNVNGQTIATRDFKPSEYLGRSVAAGARLRPKTPFQVELDVLAPEEAAVSFEFSFL
jgi:predicted Zn finger-like uncharacterized protein